MKKKEARDLSPEELRQKEKEIRDEVFRLKMKRSASALDNKMLIRNKRKDLARVITILNAKTEGKAG